MQLSVIILNYNVRYFLEQCVLSVQKALESIDGEIIVVDNNSQDDSCEMMKLRFPNVKLIQNKENLGFPKGNNMAVAQAKGDYICILNPDTVVAEDTFEKVLNFAQKQINLGIIGVKLIDGTGHFLPESKRGIPTPFVAFTKISSLYKIFPKSKLFGRYYAEYLDENETGKAAIFVGAFMVLKRELYNEIGGFDENCFMYSDDIDLSYQVLKQGKSNYYFHETSVIHYKGESTIKDETYMKRFQEAMDFFYKKHFKMAIVFSVFMKLGILFFSFAKMFQAQAKIKKTVNSYLLLSSDEILLEKLNIILENKVGFRNLKTEKMVISSLFSESKTDEIILDNRFLTFKECISIFEVLKDNGFTFKIRPQDSNFLIGSNTNIGRGEIIMID